MVSRSEDSSRSEMPWWLEAGPQTCDFCLRAYHTEAGRHCPECDRPICPLCVAEVRVNCTWLCPECQAGGE